MVFAHALLRGPEQAFTYDINGKSIEQRAREWAEGFKQTGQPDFQDKAIALDGIGLTARSRNALLRKDQTLQYDASRVLHILPHHIRNFGPVSFVDTLHCLVVAGFPWLNLIDGSVFWRTAPASWKERWKVHMRIGK